MRPRDRWDFDGHLSVSKEDSKWVPVPAAFTPGQIRKPYAAILDFSLKRVKTVGSALLILNYHEV